MTITRVREVTDPQEYSSQLIQLMAEIGTLEGDAVSGMIDILADAQTDIAAQIAAIPWDSPSRAMLLRAQAGIDQSLANLLQTTKTNLATWQAEGHALGINLAIKPLGGERGFDLIAASVSLEQLQIMQGFSAELIQSIPEALRKRINAEITSVVVGAKTPFAAAKAIGFNLTDPNHFTSIAHRARAIVVTEVGRAQSLGTQVAQTELQRLLTEGGDPQQVQKRWLNGHLPGARLSHLEAEAKYSPEGSVGPIAVNAFYEIGGFKAYYPKDPSLPPSESVHCHCVSITVLTDDAGTMPPSGELGAAKASFTGAKATAQAPADAILTKKLNKPATMFLADPYGSAGLSPVKSLKPGGTGFGGKIMAAKLGIKELATSGFKWDSKLGAWVHPKAIAGKQLPDFKDLFPKEQLGLMNSAGLSSVSRNQILKHLDIDLPKGSSKIKYAASTPIAAAPLAPAAKPLPKRAKPKKRKAGKLEQLEPLPRNQQATLGANEYAEALKKRLADSTADVFDDIAARDLKAKIMGELGDALEAAFDERTLNDFAFDFPKRYQTVGNTLNKGQEIMSDIVRTWASTSGDANPGSLMMQRSAAELFDLPWPPVGYTTGRAAEAIATADRLYELHKDVADFITQGMYDNTQKVLTELGYGDTIRLARGIDMPFDVHTALGLDGKLEEVMLNPLSSFAQNRSISKQFGNVTVWVDVPKERILSCSFTGYGCLHEYEFVVIGAAEPELAFVARS